jgi:hypothetical protein
LKTLKGRVYSEDQGVDGKRVLEWILEKQIGIVWTGFICLRIGTSGGPCEHGNEPSGSIKGGEILD